MPDPKRICAFYSRGPHFMRLLAFLREREPQAHITAVVPPGYPKALLGNRADAVIETAKAQYAARDLAGIRDLLRTIRAGRFDEFVVMFDSPRLRLLAAFTGAARRSVFTVDGRCLPLTVSPVAVLVSWLYRSLRGRLTFAYIYCVVHGRPVERRK
ncbi:MAG TPA: hypothetical protein PKI11_10500 [Candidatus Hydrogenedentes bacterium]|nr:hypothetical protein [Candidatus Hydrogenedentota bacterium]HNT89519.1 hypothetical protein [Candidatus Hydrogenedentota bacterium]